MKNKKGKLKLCIGILILFIVLFNAKVYAEEIELKVEMPSKEMNNGFIPSVLKPIYFEDDEESNVIDNVFTRANTVYSNTLVKYDLRTIIPENLNVKNQGSTGFCWAFTGIAVLETRLALNDMVNSSALKVYDFSEKHMVYSSAKNSFLNGEINETGIIEDLSAGGTMLNVQSYLTNGKGAISESDMPFIDSQEDINIQSLYNKDVQSTVHDTIFLESAEIHETEKVEKIKEEIKQFLNTSGALYMGIHGASPFGDSEIYNNDTGALYTPSLDLYPINHAVTVVGYDDNYSKENFVDTNKPTIDGAWIVKNSWGETITVGTIDEYKQILYEQNTSYFQSIGYTNYSQIPDDITIETIINNGYIYNAEKRTLELEIGDSGYMYVSYQDPSIYSGNTWGIEKAVNEKDYNNIYKLEYNEHDYMEVLNTRNVKLANVFTRNTTEVEYIDRVAISSLSEAQNCKVYMNPNGSSKNEEDLIEIDIVTPKSNNTVDIEPGFTTIEFTNPVEVSSDTFTVVIEISNEAENAIYYFESNHMGEVNKNESFVYDEINKKWIDIGDSANVDTIGNLPIKAFTIDVEPILTSIEIISSPTKSIYYEGENFDKTGLRIMANYNTYSEKEITNFQVISGENLVEGQETVVIRYTENGVTKEVSVNITVNPNSVLLEEIEISTTPDKVIYIEGENFDKTGMEVKAVYSNNTKKDITNYTVVNGSNLNLGQTSVIIRYEENGVIKEKNVAITVNPMPVVLEKIEVSTNPNKVIYVEGENFDKTGMIIKAIYSNNNNKEITSYTVENGTNLTKGQTNVKIKYTEAGISKETTVDIVVNEKEADTVYLAGLIISINPDKTNYLESEDFDKTGMIVKAVYSDGSQKEITNYTVENGENLQENQESISITYSEGSITKKINVEIIVEKGEDVENVILLEIQISQNPDKTNYVEGENFDKTGMIVKAIYSDNSVKEITNYIIENGEDLKEIDKTVTISYTENNIKKEVNVSVIVEKEQITYETIKNDLLEANAIFLSGKIYGYEDNTKNYFIYNFKINDIEQNAQNANYEYYYYVSTKLGKSVEDDEWTKIENISTIDENGKNELILTFDSREVAYMSELLQDTASDEIYIYIKEVVTTQDAVLTEMKEMEILNSNSNLDIEVYFNDVLVGQLEDVEGEKDETVAPNELPETGLRNTIMIISIILTIIGIFSYKRYKNIDK